MPPRSSQSPKPRRVVHARTPTYPRRHKSSATYGLIETAGGAMVAASIVGIDGAGNPANGPIAHALQGDFVGALGEAANNLTNILQGGPRTQMFWTGLATFIGGRAARALVPSFHRHGLRLGRHLKLALA